jgi:hypothetical protein
MDAKIIHSVNKEVYRNFPELAGVNPQVSPHRSGSSSSAANGNTLFTYRKQVKTADNKTLERLVRVVVDGSGKIIKITTSH